GAAIKTGQGTGTGTIDNPNSPPRIAIGGAAVIAGPGGTPDATFTVSLSAPSDLPVTVVGNTSDGTAKAGVDYVAIAPTTLTFAPGVTERTLTVKVNPEPATASDKSFAVLLSNPSGAAIATASG